MIGLTSIIAVERLGQYGSNELPSKAGLSNLKIFISQISSFLTILLVIAAVLSFLIGEKIDGLLILLILLLNTSLGFWQEYKASKELEALRKLEVVNTRVIRDGIEKRISAKELVPGDLIILEAGDKIPADAKIIESFNLSVNEASLTGESLAVIKTIDKQNNQIFFGTVLVSGRGKAEVVTTGKNTKFGKIALTLANVIEEQTPLEITLNSLGKKIGILAIIIAVLVFSIQVAQGWDVLEVFFTSVALMVAVVPEGLPAVITISLAFGVHRMYKKHTLVRKMSAIESLGAATVICTDKTGTLTYNQMRVKEVSAKKYTETDLLKTAVLCNSASLVLNESSQEFDVLGDTTEGSLLIWAKEQGMDIDLMRREGKLAHENPFSLERRMMSVVWQNNGKQTMYTKGAPEIILSKSKLSDKEIEKLTQEYEKLASQGLRVLGFAIKDCSKQKKITFTEDNLTFLGFIGIADTARVEAREAIIKAKRAGIAVVMITGDNELTARAIGEELSVISAGDEILTGKQLDELDDKALIERLDKIKIFARVVPEHKLRIVKAFQQKGEIVAVTGDGVNDSLALKQAEVGISMGKTGTDVAKEASDLIILDDDFSTIIAAIEEGRLIYNNILKVIRFLLAGNLSEVLVIVGAVVIGLPSPFLPVQILWINFVTDGLPALSLVVDSPSNRLMQTPPQKHTDVILKAETLKIVGIGGLVMSGITLAGFISVLNLFGLEEARNVAFSLLVFSQMVFIFVMRKHHSILSNKYLLFSVLCVVILQLLILLNPTVRDLFNP